jgi:solute carrier family 8 (sodium/calcium exchanger)
MVLPLFGEWELSWPAGVQIVLYFLGLVWCFMGVAIIADVFMGAIERITAKKRRKLLKNTQKHVTVKVWNDTVANLTLMALGSSAPEILLNVIGVVGNGFKSEQLGPSTIVGSAAFNLFCITAVCIYSIPDGESKTIKYMGVFAVTASFSLFAYIWLLLIIVGPWSKDVVTLWESLVTFAFFPILTALAYMADIGMFSKTAPERKETILTSTLSKEELARMECSIKKKHGSTITEAQLLALIEFECAPPKTRAQYRIAATRTLTKGQRVFDPSQKKHETMEELKRTSTCFDNDKANNWFNFEKAEFVVLESKKVVDIVVKRTGNLSQKASVSYQTQDANAKEGKDYEKVEGSLEFEPNVQQMLFQVKIIDDEAWEASENFKVKLTGASAATGESNSPEPCKPKVGELGEADVWIVDDDKPGVLSFEQEVVTVKGSPEKQTVTIKVLRHGGNAGRCTVKYHT